MQKYWLGLSLGQIDIKKLTIEKYEKLITEMSFYEHFEETVDSQK